LAGSPTLMGAEIGEELEVDLPEAKFKTLIVKQILKSNPAQ